MAPYGGRTIDETSNFIIDPLIGMTRFLLHIRGISLAAAFLMVMALLFANARTASAQDCPDLIWTVNIDADVALCAFPIIVETAWGPTETRSPDPATDFPGFTTGGTSATFPLPEVTPRPFRHAYITSAVNPLEVLGDIKVAAGESKTVPIGCCCCVILEVVKDDQNCVTVTVRRGTGCF